MTTFKCASVKREYFTFEDKPLEKVAEEFAHERNIDYETGNSNYPLVEMSKGYKHGLVAAVETAKTKHRNTYVNHSGKRKLIVDGIKYNIQPKGICEPNHNQTGWVGFVEEIAELLNNNTKCDITEIMTKPFSTTGPMESQVFRCCLMEAMQNYFEYVCCLACGIPEVCLLERIDRLSKLLPDLNWWFIKVNKIIDNFVSSMEGKPDINWWNRIVTEIPVNSGFQTKLTGWVGDLFPYSKGFDSKLKRNNTSPYYSEIGQGLTFTPVILDDQFYTGKEYKLRLAAGFLGAGENKETQRLRPVQGWMMFYEA
ncbi:hypothetical protein ACJMK2_036508 [Sinanodonta woodiana]|uniref:Uncharacterized protein n=1 Tax=Sinanodonta woodiana TaxID=1069815 RepID=A0ABD3WHE4_SINWO